MKGEDYRFKISVIITCFNEGERIYKAIDSVTKQTFKEIELILVNDSSNDPTTNKICDLVLGQGIKVLRTERNLGPSGARNRGIAEASGEIIIPLDADDVLPVDAAEILHNKFISDSDIDFVFGNYIKNDLENRITYIVDCSCISNEKNEIDPVKLYQSWVLLGMSPFRKSLWSRLNGYSLEFSYTCQDVDFQIRSILGNAKSRYINQIIYEYNKSTSGINSSKANLESLVKCYYNNYDFILKYAQNNDAFAIALEFTDSNKLKLWARKKREEGKQTFKSMIFSIVPETILPQLKCLYLSFKKIKNWIFKHVIPLRIYE